MHLGAAFEEKSMGVERLDTVGGVKLTESNQTPNTVDGNQGVTTGANIRGQKGNNPDHQLRSLNHI